LTSSKLMRLSTEISRTWTKMS